MEDVRGIMSEVAALASCEGVGIDSDAIANAIAKARRIPAGDQDLVPKRR